MVGLLLLVGCSLLLFLVLQRSRSGAAFVLDDRSGRALWDVFMISVFVFLLVHVSGAISLARDVEQVRLLHEKRCLLSLEEGSEGASLKVQSALANIITLVKETSVPPTIMGQSVTSLTRFHRHSAHRSSMMFVQTKQKKQV